MKISCNSKKLKTDQLYILGKHAESLNNFHITIGNDYIVFGLRFNGVNNGCFVQILSDYNHLIEVPILLFDIIDSRSSGFWEIKLFSEGSITLWPPSFYREYYHDDLFEEVLEIVEDFKKVNQQITTEFT